MLRQFKLMILANVVLGVSFLISNYVYFYFSTRFDGLVALWNPFWLTIFNNKAAATIGDFGAQYPNFSFYFFWVLMSVNIYFLYKLQKTANLK